MNKRFLFNWSVWIGLVTGIYTALYLLSPLAQYGVVYATFIALPIYFIAGAKKEEYFNFTVSNATGVAWGWAYITAITGFTEVGMNNIMANALACGLITIICCSFHFIITPNTLFNKLPAMFGGIAAAFSTGATQIVPLMITLVLGSTLALICNMGTKLLADDGSWKFLNKPEKWQEADKIIE